MKEIKIGNEVFESSEESFRRCLKELCKKNNKLRKNATSINKDFYISWLEEILYHKGIDTFDYKD